MAVRRHCFVFAGIRDVIKMDMRSQAIWGGFLRKAKQVVI